MSIAMTFQSLTADVQNYLDRGQNGTVDAVVYNQIPSLINMAERSIARMLKPQFFDTNVTGFMTASNPVIQKPDRWRETISINYGTGTSGNTRTSLFPRSYEYIRSYWPDPTVTGAPQFYADYNSTNWLIGPTPDQAYPFEVNYFEMPRLLDDSNATNKITEQLPQLLLYRTLLECAPFIKNDERIPIWQKYFDEAFAAANAEDVAKVVDRSVTRQSA